MEAIVQRDGDKIKIVGIEKHYRGGEFVRDEEIHQLATSDFYVRTISEGDASDSGMVTTEQIEKLLRPLLCGGRFGFELDVYLSDVIRIPELMLMESDKVKYIGEEDINGILCQHINADTKYGFFTVYIDTRNNYVVRRAISEINQHTLLYGGDKWLHDMPQTQTFTDVIDNFEFKLIGSVNVPIKGVLQTTRKDKDGSTVVAKSEFERENVDLNPNFEKDVFSATFLKGEVVSNLDDKESGVVYVWDGEKAVPGYTMLEGSAKMQGYAGFTRLCSMLLGIVLIVYVVIKKLLFKKKKHE